MYKRILMKPNEVVADETVAEDDGFVTAAAVDPVEEGSLSPFFSVFVFLASDFEAAAAALFGFLNWFKSLFSVEHDNLPLRPEMAREYYEKLIIT